MLFDNYDENDAQKNKAIIEEINKMTTRYRFEHFRKENKIARE